MWTAGRMKTEQVVLEFLYKVAELIIQSRVAFEADLDAAHRGNRRARVRFAWSDLFHTSYVLPYKRC